MRILICDDDALIVEQLKKYIKNFVTIQPPLFKDEIRMT